MEKGWTITGVEITSDGQIKLCIEGREDKELKRIVVFVEPEEFFDGIGCAYQVNTNKLREEREVVKNENNKNI